ncbi:putative mediator complex subunit 15, KIX domain-containing protein [Helianthus annuus]|uniref:Mediator complex subunit 15, KIX domain-containing protein n=1 Tax=Helianthus annuus TaxID=4232 RepID=A0A9K3JHT0_HELAN|nr:mediator of RNA polymerase II transcription subunit 15a isoform X2 [Helianthus annuus]KAF5815399.1 putative mediator complex subunit 15, KIX domain-containing protein [Helianthus annuus]
MDKRPIHGDPAMEFRDWRAQLQRKRIINKIMDTLKKHLPFSGYERLQELKKIAERVEREIHTAATSQSEYSRKVCFMMLTMETRLKNPMLSNSAAITIKAMQKLYLLESDDWKAQLQDSSSLPSALPPGNDLQQPTLTNVAGQNINMQTIQNMSSVQQNQLIGQQYNYLVTQGHPLYQEQLQQLLQQRMLQQQRLRPTEGASVAVGDPTMESGDWRAQLQADIGERIMNKLLDTVKKHPPFPGHEGQQVLTKIAERIEEEIYFVATTRSDYLRKISLKMLIMVNTLHNPM